MPIPAFNLFRWICWRMLQALLIGVVLMPHGALAALTVMDDSSLADVTGQALLNADRIVDTNISGTEPTANQAIPGLAFYRIGVDGSLAFNMNINRLQLGCGGVNDQIMVGCDIDLSNVSFMGLNSAGTGAGAAVSSDFSLLRPFLEIAVANDGSANRQIVGINVSSQSATGYLSLGNVYSNGQTNLETGGTCSTSSTGHGPGCESGLNMLSGYLQPTFTGYLQGCVSFIGSCDGSYTSCLSAQTTITCPSNTPTSGGTSGTPISCTRCVTGETKLNGGAPTTAILGPLTLTPLNVPIKVADVLSYFHGIAFDGTSDFGISFERQQIAWPTYAKTGWNPTANTGWWMNAPNNIVANVVDPSGPTISWTSPLTGALISNLDLNQAPTTNCYGLAHFC